MGAALLTDVWYEPDARAGAARPRAAGDPLSRLPADHDGRPGAPALRRDRPLGLPRDPQRRPAGPAAPDPGDLPPCDARDDLRADRDRRRGDADEPRRRPRDARDDLRAPAPRRPRSGSSDEGEILVRGVSVCDGYYATRRRTREAFDADGWLHTGDRGALDAEGRVKFLGRLKEMLKVGGENVAAVEIESHISRIRRSSSSRSSACPTSGWGDPRGLRRAAARRRGDRGGHRRALPRRDRPFKVPRYVRFVDEWPMSASKIQKGRCASARRTSWCPRMPEAAALVTGAAQGIGEAIARRLAAGRRAASASPISTRERARARWPTEIGGIAATVDVRRPGRPRGRGARRPRTRSATSRSSSTTRA